MSGGHGVGAEEAGADADRALSRDGAGDAEHAELGVAVEAVAGLDLDGGHAFGDQGVDAGEGTGEERRLVGLAGGADGGHDAAAGAGQLLVGGAFEAHLELAGAVAAEDHVGVAVDERRGDEAAGEVALGQAAAAEVGGGADGGDAAVLDGNGGVGEEAVGGGAELHRGDGGVGQEICGLCQAPHPLPCPA